MACVCECMCAHEKFADQSLQYFKISTLLQEIKGADKSIKDVNKALNIVKVYFTTKLGKSAILDINKSSHSQTAFK